MKKTLILLLTICNLCVSYSQLPNADYRKGSLSVNLVKSPESQSFEKFGDIPVNEYSGVAAISVPLYTLNSRSISVPITLNYHASGIKVNQEASWVGLGFDLSCGGRITVETRGNVDKVNYSSAYRAGVTKLFNKWSKPYGPYQNVSNNAIKVGYAFLDYGDLYPNNDPIYHRGDTLWDNASVISTSAWDGDAQPDIYHASFLGGSVNFYFDLETSAIKQIGEKSTATINALRDPNTGALLGFDIFDNDGSIYRYDQTETTYFSLPFGGTQNYSSNAISTWLLTKITKNSEEIFFTYGNFGIVKPAVNWSQSITGHMPNPVNDPGDTRQNYITVNNKYLTRIESNSTIVDFVLGGRIDLDGDGSRRLDKISIKEKITNSEIKSFQFSYSYFTANAEVGDNNLPDIKTKRLKLLSVKEGNVLGSPWQFFYSTLPVPNKYSFAQDHWGYYNGMANTSLVPSYNSSLMNYYLGIHYEQFASCGYADPTECMNSLSGYSIPTSFQGTANRNCNSQVILTCMVDSIVYPTGGATKYVFEPHISTFSAKQLYNFLGGGLRVSEIRNYNMNQLENITRYDYLNSGIYLGSIEYLKISTKWPQGNSFTLSSCGLQNNDDQTVGYGSVKKSVLNSLGIGQNGYEINYFKANIPLLQENVFAPQPYCYYYDPTICSGTAPSTYLFYLDRSGNGPMPKKELDGKLYKTEIFSNDNQLVKSAEYFFKQVEQSQRFFSAKAEDNYLGYQNTLVFQHSVGSDLGAGPGSLGMTWRRWLVSLEPATSYFTILDSIIENLKAGNFFIKTKRAFKYNSFWQPEMTSIDNKDGSQNITFTKFPGSYLPYPQLPSGGSGAALILRNNLNMHRYELPMEQMELRREVNGDTLVLGARFNVYCSDGYLDSSLVVENEKPLLFRTELAPSNFLLNYPYSGTYDLGRDIKYKLIQTGNHSTTGVYKDISLRDVSTAYLFDEQNNNLLATCSFSTNDQIAFSSFEYLEKGHWNYNGTCLIASDAITGKKVYELSSGTISSNVIAKAGNYTVSYWSKNGPQYISNSTYIIGPTINGYTYVEHTLYVGANTIVTLSGNGWIDELRLYPVGSRMKSYCYLPLVGISSECDFNNRVKYYDYDQLGRLVLTRDENRNIINRYCYTFAGQQENCTICTDFAPNWQNTQSPPVCEQNTCGNTGYVLQEKRDINTCSPSYDSIQIVRTYDPGTCSPSQGVNINYYNYIGDSGFTVTYSNAATGMVYTFPLPVGTGILGCIPAASYTVTISKPGNTITYLFSLVCKMSTGVSATFGKTIVSSSTCNIVTIDYEY